MKRNRQRWAIALAVGLAGSGWWPAGAQETVAPAEPLAATPPAIGAAATPPPPVTPEQLQALQQQVYELTKQLRQVEVAMEGQQKTADDKAKAAPVITAGAKGFGFTSADKAFDLKVGGRIGYDVGWFSQDSELEDYVGDEQDGTGFRYARLRLSGKLWEYVTFQAEYDFAGENGADSPKFRDVFIQLNGIPYGGGRTADLRVGHFREPFSLEDLTGIPNRTFLERSLMHSFVPNRNAGVQISDALFGETGKERLSYQLGVFKETDDLPSANDSDEDQGYQITGRVTGLPWYREDGRKLIHLAAAYSHRNPDGAPIAWPGRTETRLSALRYTDINKFPGYRLNDALADDIDLLGLEAALVYGPLSVQAEYTKAMVDTTLGGDADFDGGYVQASYFLTGEHRPYRHENGIFDRITPNKNFGWKSVDGWGAWELAARYSFVDLEDGPIRGGEQQAYTLGLSWYLNPNLRITTNYILNNVETDRYDGDFSALQTRFQLEF